MKFTRNMFHYPGMTSLAKLREEAAGHAKAGDTVVLHLHEYEPEPWPVFALHLDGCPLNLKVIQLEKRPFHEVFEAVVP